MGKPKSKSDIAGADDTLPGASPDPATNLIMADIAMRAGSYALRSVVERSFLSSKYDPSTAKQIVKGRGVRQTVVSVALAKIATRSLPGAAAVGAGLFAKTLFDRSQKRRKAKRMGEKQLA